MRFLRTASTTRLLAVLAAVVVAVGGGAAIAVAATTSNPVPAPASLAERRSRQALAAPKVAGDQRRHHLHRQPDRLLGLHRGKSTDPLLQGASGRLWLTADGRLRLELQSDDGDAEIVVHQRSFWISDPAQHTVYEGTLPASAHGDSHASPTGGIPSVAQIQSELTRLMGQADLSGAQPDRRGRSGGLPGDRLAGDVGRSGRVLRSWRGTR